ncbi:MAG TPA: hypothetical protein VMU04_23530 [Candidatus Acidoferrum sp.]|nr:hypothetical protein [Candidatus Acidoferrum sp.]
MSDENLWGELPVSEVKRTPVQILKEQASLLTQMTRSVLVGFVGQMESAGDLRYALDIRAPALNNYTARIVLVIHPITLYPLSLVVPSGGTQTCQNEAAFVEALKARLQSESVRKLVAALLVQSDAAKGTSGPPQDGNIRA